MAKQFGIIILTDSVTEAQEILAQHSETVSTVHEVAEQALVGNVPAPVTASPAVDAAHAAPTVLVDVNGMPWDSRIHTGAVEADGTPKKTVKGVWQKRRGITQTLIREVEAELMGTAAGDAAIPSQQGDIEPDLGAANPPPTPAVGIPGQPPLVLPVPADTTTATMQDCVNITQVFAQIHGADEMNKHLKAWGMTEISQLPPEHFKAYVDYMVAADAAGA
jgi:hypothetical protein